MATEIYLVKVGMTMTEGMVEEWYVPDGGTVKRANCCIDSRPRRSISTSTPTPAASCKPRRRRGRDDAARRRHRSHLCAGRSDPLDGTVSDRGGGSGRDSRRIETCSCAAPAAATVGGACSLTGGPAARRGNERGSRHGTRHRSRRPHRRSRCATLRQTRLRHLHRPRRPDRPRRSRSARRRARRRSRACDRHRTRWAHHEGRRGAHRRDKRRRRNRQRPCCSGGENRCHRHPQRVNAFP